MAVIPVMLLGALLHLLPSGMVRVFGFAGLGRPGSVGIHAAGHVSGWRSKGISRGHCS